MVRVIARKDEPFEKVLRRFRREVEKAGILKATKVRGHYEKPSVRKKRKARAARRRWIKRVKRVKRINRGT
ncbi:MAG: 30S ribosomal protein S21 [Candidatus Hodarchaeota archaeon]